MRLFEYSCAPKFLYKIEKLKNERNFDCDEMFKQCFEDKIKDMFADEIADAMIRFFDLAGGLI